MYPSSMFAGSGHLLPGPFPIGAANTVGHHNSEMAGGWDTVDKTTLFLERAEVAQ